MGGIKHGLRKSKEYNAWQHMKTRCLNQHSKAYPNYGGRGICVCERWMSFAAFYEDMGPAPSIGHSLERIENDKGYYKENCKWATIAEQNRNKRTTRNIIINGETKKLFEWLNHYKMFHATFNHRIEKLGMTDQEALTTPLQDIRNNLSSNHERDKNGKFLPKSTKSNQGTEDGNQTS